MVEKMQVIGGTRLEGVVSVSGGKNTAVAIIPAALLCDEPCTIDNLPDIDDVHALAEILRHLGAGVVYEQGVMRIDPRGVGGHAVPFHLAQRMRASSYLIGALLGRVGRAEVPFPGGCVIGARPIDQHIKGMRALGATVDSRGDTVRARADALKGSDVFLDMVTVGGTINIMLAAARAVGNTVIYNAAKEPHIVDVANFLNSMGAHVKGAGTDVIRIRGVQRLWGCSYTVIPDQIETGTLMIAAAATHGDVTVTGCIPTHMDSLAAKLLEMGARIDAGDDAIRVRSYGAHRAINIKTQVYPGFPTDLQQPMTALLCTAKGSSMVTENIFENRFRHLSELQRMGANVRVMDRTAIIDGVEGLFGASVYITDLRAGAALVIGALMAEGVTEIANTHYIERGYEHLERKLCELGANIRRVQVEESSPLTELVRG
jgi:UDP-N-acetylglucosamine 1-carboxyvinyltransferase